MAPKKDKQSSSNVFVKDNEWGWIPAVQQKIVGDKATVKVFKYKNEQSVACDGGRAAKGKGDEIEVKLKDYPNNVLPLQNVDANGDLIEFADMVKLPYLHEARKLNDHRCACLTCRVIREYANLLFFSFTFRLQFCTI